jgi:hypothetical protein
MIDAAEKQDGGVRAALVEKRYEELRGLCEIVVEHELFKGVVQSYALNILLTKLDKIFFSEYLYPRQSLIAHLNSAN